MISAFIRSKVCRCIGEGNQEQDYLAEALQDPWGKEIYICIVGQHDQLGRPQSYVCHARLNDSIPQGVNSTIGGIPVQANRRDLSQRERGFTRHPLIRNISSTMQVQEPHRPFIAPTKTSIISSACAIPQRVRNSKTTLSFVAYFTTTVQPYIDPPLHPGVIALGFARDHPAVNHPAMKLAREKCIPSSSTKDIQQDDKPQLSAYVGIHYRTHEVFAMINSQLTANTRSPHSEHPPRILSSRSYSSITNTAIQRVSSSLIPPLPTREAPNRLPTPSSSSSRTANF